MPGSGTDEDDAWLGAGVVVALVAMAASSNVAIYLTPPDSTVPAGRRARARGGHAARSAPPVSGAGARIDVVVVSYRSAPLIGRTIAVAHGLAGPTRA